MSAWARGLGAAAALLLALPAVAKPKLRPGERVDLNRATAAELMRLPGVGAKRAQAIVAHRARRPFRSPREVLAVKGLGKAWFRGVEQHLEASVSQPASPPRAARSAAASSTAVASR